MSYQQLLAQAQHALQNGRPEQAAVVAEQALQQRLQDADAHYNAGYYARQAGAYAKALKYYQQALALGVREPEEVENNIAVIYSDALEQPEQALAALQRALAYNPNYLPALHNLANWYEQVGERTQASRYFQAVLKLDPQNYLAAARLADVHRATSVDDELLTQLHRFTEQSLPAQAQADVQFAIAKLLNDCGAYQQSWRHLCLANQAQRHLLPRWNQAHWAANVAQLRHSLQTSVPNHTESLESAPDGFQPLFVCGMFRSGSTLVEQLLGGHERITTGGELAYFPTQFNAYLMGKISSEQLQPLVSQPTKQHELQSGYLAFLRERFESNGQLPAILTDKRPDNFWLLHFIKQVMPRAKFVVTQRHPLDNLVSIYFSQLGAAMAYATDVKQIAEYLLLQQEQLKVWQAHYSDDVVTVQYEALVRGPEAALTPVFELVGEQWQSQCLQFHTQRNVVKTASVWQVRQPLHQSSCGRWQHFQAELEQTLGTELFKRLHG